MDRKPRPCRPSRLFWLAGVGAALTLNLKHQFLLHRRQPPGVEDQGSVLVRGCLPHTGKHDVHVGMGGVAMLSRDPSQTVGTAVGLEATDGSPGQPAQVETLGMLRRENEPIDRPAAIGQPATGTAGDLWLGALEGASHEVAELSPLLVAHRSLGSEEPTLRSALIPIGDVLQQAAHAWLRRNVRSLGVLVAVLDIAQEAAYRPLGHTRCTGRRVLHRQDHAVTHRRRRLPAGRKREPAGLRPRTQPARPERPCDAPPQAAPRR